MSSDKFGDRRLAAAGAYESEAPPHPLRSSGLAGVAEVHVVLAVLAAFWGRVWGLGAPRHSPQLRESVLGRREAVPLGRLLWEMLDHFAVRPFSYRCPGPSLGLPLP